MPYTTLFLAAVRQVAPKAAAAVLKYAPQLAAAARTNPQVGTFVEQASVKLRRPGDRVSKLIEFGRSLAAAELAAQTLPERQTLCRNWLSRMRAHELTLQQAKLKPRAAAKAARDHVAAEADSTVTEIIETIAKWSEQT